VGGLFAAPVVIDSAPHARTADPQAMRKQTTAGLRNPRTGRRHPAVLGWQIQSCSYLPVLRSTLLIKGSRIMRSQNTPCAPDSKVVFLPGVVRLNCFGLSGRETPGAPSRRVNGSKTNASRESPGVQFNCCWVRREPVPILFEGNLFDLAECHHTEPASTRGRLPRIRRTRFSKPSCSKRSIVSTKSGKQSGFSMIAVAPAAAANSY
jgi:hypothetical protein